jgi:hypothetical protein
MTQFTIESAQYEIAYRQDRLASDFHAANGTRRRSWRRSRQHGPVGRTAHGTGAVRARLA